MDPLCALLAAPNACEAAICIQEYRNDRTPKSFWACASWIGSTAFWLIRGVVPL